MRRASVGPRARSWGSARCGSAATSRRPGSGTSCAGCSPTGAFTATGSDCRSLQLLVQAAALEGLEVCDPRGFIVRASDRLVQAFGSEPDHKRLPLRWAVEVRQPTASVPDGYRYRLERTGADQRGRVLAFTPGTDVRLWSGDCV